MLLVVRLNNNSYFVDEAVFEVIKLCIFFVLPKKLIFKDDYYALKILSYI